MHLPNYPQVPEILSKKTLEVLKAHRCTYLQQDTLEVPKALIYIYIYITIILEVPEGHNY